MNVPLRRQDALVGYLSMIDADVTEPNVLHQVRYGNNRLGGLPRLSITHNLGLSRWATHWGNLESKESLVIHC